MRAHGDEMPGDEFFDGGAPYDAEPSRPARESKGKGPKLADLVVREVTERAELFHDAKHVAWARVSVGPRKAVFKLRSREMRTWISFAARELGSIMASALEEAITTLEGIALHASEEREVHLRVAEVDGAIFIDLGDASGRCVHVTKRGWRVLDVAPVMFRRPSTMRALPVPERGGKLDELRPFVNVDDDGFLLFVAWIVAAYRPGRPFTILAIHGEHGAAKSTGSKVARELVDPNVVPIRSPPRNEDDLIVAAAHSHVVAFDNLSGVLPWLSDSLCRLATGGGLTKRALYTDDDEIAIEVLRPIVVNGIDDIANRADLAERCIVLELQPIGKGKRKSERAFRAAFAAAAPRVLGVLLDGVASALRNLESVDEGDLPRMADFATWIAAAEPGLGLKPGTLLAAYARNRQRAVDLALQSSPIAVALRALLALPSNAGRWEGEPEQLLEALSDLTPDATRRMPSWPKNAASLSRALRRAATFLRTVGVEVHLDGTKGRGDGKSRAWRLELVGDVRGRDGVAMGTQSDEPRSA